MKLTCPKCGKSLSENDVFCSHCGIQINENITLSKGKIIKIYVISFLLAPLGLYWFFKYIKDPDPKKRKVAKNVLWVTALAIILMVFIGIYSINRYNSLLDEYYNIYNLD